MLLTKSFDGHDLNTTHDMYRLLWPLSFCFINYSCSIFVAYVYFTFLLPLGNLSGTFQNGAILYSLLFSQIFQLICP